MELLLRCRAAGAALRAGAGGVHAANTTSAYPIAWQTSRCVAGAERRAPTKNPGSLTELHMSLECMPSCAWDHASLTTHPVVFHADVSVCSC